MFVFYLSLSSYLLFLVYEIDSFRIVSWRESRASYPLFMSLLEKPKTNALFKPTAHDIYTGRDPNRIKIFDTTLRDGEQSPGCTMNTDEKVIVAKQLVKLGVDVIEAGFPLASLGDFESVSKIAQTIGKLGLLLILLYCIHL
jgi:hypothetical protein